MIISYQLFTQIAVHSIVSFTGSLLPQVGELLISNIDVIAFVHAFAWIFVLSSVIPSIILGKGRSIFLQFLLCLAVTFMAVSAEYLLTLFLGTQVNVQLQALAPWFQNPLVAVIYLSAPYLFMLYLDIRTRRKAKETEKLQQKEETFTPDEETAVEQQEQYAIVDGTQDESDSHPVSRGRGSNRALYGIAAICFALAFATFSLGEAILPAIVTPPATIVYVAIFACIGLILTFLGRHTFHLT